MGTHATFGSTATNTGGVLPHQLGDCDCQPTSTLGDSGVTYNGQSRW
jgi:hypothetical protein